MELYSKYYRVLLDGTVISVRKDRPLIPQVDNKGYLYVTFTNAGKSKKFKVHRLVALGYLPNPDNKPEVNHKDGDKTNNHVSNLEWCTSSENQKHAWGTGLQKLNSSHQGCRDKFLKVSPELAKEIQGRYVPRCRVNGTRAMAKEYGLANGTISRIINEPEKYL